MSETGEFHTYIHFNSVIEYVAGKCRKLLGQNVNSLNPVLTHADKTILIIYAIRTVVRNAEVF